jgi:hypothetical protein
MAWHINDVQKIMMVMMMLMTMITVMKSFLLVPAPNIHHRQNTRLSSIICKMKPWTRPFDG